MTTSTTTRRCLCPGSYDPITLGHLDVIGRCARMYDEVVVAVLHNPAKQGLFTVDERIAMIGAELAGLPNVVTIASSGRLLVDVCAELDIPVVVKGVRGETDYAFEQPMAVMNRHLTGLETLFLPGDPAYTQVSSSLIKEVVTYGGDVTGLVSDAVRDALVARLR